MKGRPESGRFFWGVRPAGRVVRQHHLVAYGVQLITWRWKSSTGPTGGTVSRTARVSIARWNLKEAAGKALA